MKESKQEVIKSVSLVKMAVNLLSVSSPLYSFGAKFQICRLLCVNKILIGNKFICKVELLNVKQRRS